MVDLGAVGQRGNLRVDGLQRSTDLHLHLLDARQHTGQEPIALAGATLDALQVNEQVGLGDELLQVGTGDIAQTAAAGLLDLDATAQLGGRLL